MIMVLVSREMSHFFIIGGAKVGESARLTKGKVYVIMRTNVL